MPELPPRARRIPLAAVYDKQPVGTTSACAENTENLSKGQEASGNYLRVRGEYFRYAVAGQNHWELPPRARRIPAPGTDQWRTMGTTSACAENTCPQTAQGPCVGNYLRVRGEYLFTPCFRGLVSELPPRARRIRKNRNRRVRGRGTTSACAENTPEIFDRHLIPLELPPRARRILDVDLYLPRAMGTTSACAENTASKNHRGPLPGNYLRVRGEYMRNTSPIRAPMELPPRARRIHPGGYQPEECGGTTSACAENTSRDAAVR